MKTLSVKQACAFIGITRQAHYKRCLTQIQRHKLLAFVHTERMYQPRIGARKLKHLMALKHVFIGRDRLFSLLAHHRLLVTTKRAYHKTTNSHHRFTCHPNLIKEGFIPNKPKQLWVADITYLPTVSGNTYLSLVTDAYSRKVVGYHVDDNMRVDSVK